MQRPLVTIEKHDRIAFVRMDRPEKRNALSVDLIEQLHSTANAMRREKDIDVVILGGSGAGFSAGADRSDRRIFSLDSSVQDQWLTAEAGAEAVRAWETLHQTTIAAIEGFVVGGAFTFALACDFRVMGREAFVSIPEVPLGFNYGWNSVPRMVSLIGPSRAKRAIMFGERIYGPQAEQWGLVDYLVDDGKVEAFALDLGKRVVSLPQLAVRFTKRAVNAVANSRNEISSHADMAQIVLCMRS